MKSHDEHIMLLRYMLAELMEKQSSPLLSEEKRVLCHKGIDALNAAVDAISVQVYA